MQGIKVDSSGWFVGCYAAPWPTRTLTDALPAIPMVGHQLHRQLAEVEPDAEMLAWARSSSPTGPEDSFDRSASRASVVTSR